MRMRRVELFTLQFIAAPDHDQVVTELMAWPLEPKHIEELPLVSTPNVDQLVKLHRPEYAGMFSQIRRARFLLPDGQPIVWLSKWKKGRELPARLTGSDLFTAMWVKLVEDHTPVLMVLANNAIGEILKKQNHALRWVVPPFYAITDEKAEQQLVDEVYNELIARPVRYVFLGLGFPKQERLALALVERLKNSSIPMPVFLLLGASFEFHAGLKKRAPPIFRKLGLEFLHRFMCEPRRMFKRYFVDDLAFFQLAWRELRAR